MIMGISGKIGSGKDTIGDIIQFLTSTNGVTSYEVWKSLHCVGNNCSNWKIVKFADALKDIICILTGCTREQLEDTDFKNSKLPAEWSNYIYYRFIDSHLSVKYISTSQKDKDYIFKEYTYRDLLQILGTDLLRNQLHENVWVNALFNKYKPKICSGSTHCALASKPEISCNQCPEYPNWIITDVRFPNEAKAIKDRGGIVIRVNRFIDKRVYVINTEQPFENWHGVVESYNGNDLYNVLNNVDDVVLVHKNNITLQDEHPSETGLDNYAFNYVIDNNDTIEELIEKVKEVLIKLKIIKL